MGRRFESLHRRHHLADARPDGGSAAVGEPAIDSVGRVHLQRAAIFAFDQHVHVVHPGVARSQVTPSDEGEAIDTRRLGTEALHITGHGFGPQLDRARWCLDARGEPRLERAEVAPGGSLEFDAENEDGEPAEGELTNKDFFWDLD